MFRLGRWVRHPCDIARRIARLEPKEKRKDARRSSTWRFRVRSAHLLFEAFSKSGVAVTQRRPGERTGGFVFLTDGGHIDNLGIYELLRRRCRLIIAIDGEADPDFDWLRWSRSQRFARIDMNVIITNELEADRSSAPRPSRKKSEEAS